MIYLDNGATSFPKPRQVVDEMTEALLYYCANPGRGAHFMAARTAHEIYKTRLAAASLFNIENAGRIVFTKNCTESLNLAIKGVLKSGDHVITSSMEHNSVLRPLVELNRKNVSLTIVKCDERGVLNPQDVKNAVRENTKMIVMTAASNVTGTKMPLESVGKIAAKEGVLFMVDGAQGAGHMSLDVKKNYIDILAAPGHKGLMGPQGTGLLYVGEGIEIRPLLSGGTGSKSKELNQPVDFPEGYEAGTLNAPGIIGLGAGIRFINKIGAEAIGEHERRLTEKLQKGFEQIRGVKIYGPVDTADKTAVVALNIQGHDCEEVALILDDKYGIEVRAGFHCSGIAHKTIGTENTGCIRFCPGFYTGEKEIEDTIKAVKEIAGK